MNIMYNVDTPEEHGCWLATRPVITPSEVTYERYSIPGRTGDLLGNMKTRGNAHITFTLHQRGSDSLHEIIQWLNTRNSSGYGWLEMNADPGSGFAYEVLDTKINSYDNRADDYRRIEVDMEVYPYKLLQGNAAELQGMVVNYNTTKTFTMESDDCEPVFLVIGEGDFWVNGNKATLSYVNGDRYVDVRKKITYYDDKSSAESTISIDYSKMGLKTGTNTIKTSSTAKVTIWTSREGYII